ncbi:Hydroxamate-type ferrisiderophore receptor [Yersinia bercovieri ATCC 43970]|uniref:Hydroxamate-type ferrisiderophore receptor n=1 Tax=Yersinia bercovieri ATCC 43970 TaxID=349968 RepID=A0ABM9XYW1_YERBE|nr:Hydroxamate-type ferrisiderophore receptor [Yersinia bercovieri ATCC 43970]
MKWQLNVKKLFDKTYYPSSGGNLRIAVGEPRQFVLRASIDF